MSLESKLLEIQSKFQQSPSWGWDNLYQCLLAVLVAEDASRFHDHLGKIFEQAWGEKFGNTDYLLEVQKLIDVFDGLRPEQSLYAIQESDGLIYSTTWPWARSPQVSFRMVFFRLKLAPKAAPNTKISCKEFIGNTYLTLLRTKETIPTTA